MLAISFYASILYLVLAEAFDRQLGFILWLWDFTWAIVWGKSKQCGHSRESLCERSTVCKNNCSTLNPKKDQDRLHLPLQGFWFGWPWSSKL